VSLAEVSSQYLERMKSMPDMSRGEAASFLVIASTLMLIKSKSLLPTIDLSEEEKESVEDLERRLKLYKKLRELEFTKDGMRVTNEFSGFEGVLSGSTRRVSESVEEQLRALFIETLGPMGQKIFEDEKAKGFSPASVKKLISELGDQGIVSERRTREFAERVGKIFNVTTSEK